MTDDGATLDVGPAKCQALLAALALSSGSSIPMWQLVESVWGEDPPRTAERTLQSYIARLRKELGQDVITRTGTAYRLNLPVDAVDVLRFDRHLDEGDVEAALAEWTGAPLAGLEAPGLDSAVAGLTERWLAATELDLERRVEVDPASTVGKLTELTATHPFREGLWALLMTALYRVDRQADALAAYRTARNQLTEQLGVEPSPRLQDLEVQILRHDPQLGAGRSQVSTGTVRLPTGTVTFAFTEIRDAARMWVDNRETMPRAMAGHHEMVQDLVSLHGGHVFSRAGDSFGVAFDRADAAVEWADDLHAATRTEPWAGGLELNVCIGVHTGEAEEHQGGYFGPAVNTAAQLAAAGHGRQTLLSQATAGFLDGVELRDLGTYRLEGVVPEQRLHQLGHGDHPALRIDALHRGNLPHRLGRLIGRDHELDTIVEALISYPVVTLVGPGGIGKTRLAVAAAERAAPEGDAWMVDLAEVDSTDQVSRAVADTLDVTERPGATLTEAIVDTLGRRRALVVLDNCEHVIEGAAHVAEAIARGCEYARVVATSRERLGVNNERIVTVPPLDPAGSAVELFNDRAAATSATFDPAFDRPAVEEICRRLDGIPLAIELAAARTISLSPADLADRLGHRLRLQSGTRRSGGDRHRTLRSAIQWSYDLLTASERTVFQQLAVFTGPFSLGAAV